MSLIESLDLKNKQIHLNKDEISSIILEEIQNFKKEKEEEKKKDQFAHKFSSLFVEALEPPEDNVELIKDSVYNFLKGYTLNENGGATYSFDQLAFNQIRRGYILFYKAINDLLKRGILDKNSVEYEWFVEGFHVMHTMLSHIKMQKTTPVLESINEGILDGFGKDQPFAPIEHKASDENPPLFSPKEEQYLKRAPPKEFAQQYVKTMFARLNLNAKILGSKQFTAVEGDIPHTDVNFELADGKKLDYTVFWIKKGDKEFEKRTAGRVSGLDNIRLYGEW